ncbi:phage tail tube protein [Neobacillus sedimentimangrovi]|uniref:Phage tail tube protein n=1 Tax=Neobacillus sedimentimangrovi TaxID=2699460 RepID=A0ABS8QG84_9BACI|nr:phage tail tube protein [Neobacillus sedimentimangrovi]MCD4838170.1 phage tail tube protein [Neobacillus sedimentimangrovi]
MPFGVLAHIGLAPETTYGEPVSAADYIRFASESINEEIEQVISENIMGVVDEAESHEGLHSISGDISGDVYPNVIGHLLRSAFGAPVTTQLSPGVYQHVFTPVQDNFSSVCALPPYTLEVHRDFEKAFQYAGAVVNELTFSFGTDTKIMQFTAAIIAKKLALINKTTPSLETTPTFMWNQGTITLDGQANSDLTTVEFGVNNNLEARATLDGTKEVSRVLRNGARTFPISLTMELKDLTEYNKFRAQNEIPAKIEMIGKAINGGTDKYKLTVEIPKLRYNSFPINVEGTGAITTQVEGSAKYDAASLYAMKITLVNSKASY